MAVNLSPVGGVAAQFFTNTGAVLTGGKLYTYAAGTTTPVATYTTSQGNVAWTNPIVLDAAGRVPNSGEIWLTNGVIYKFVLKDSNDVLIATYDNVVGVNSVDASQVTYDPPFTASVATNVEAKLAQYISVQDFGAIGDGVASDYTAFTNAIAYCYAQNLTLFAPNTGSSYNIGSALNINCKFVAGDYRVFSGAGTITIAAGCVETIYSAWFNNDSPASTIFATGHVPNWVKLDTGVEHKIRDDAPTATTYQTRTFVSGAGVDGDDVGVGAYRIDVADSQAVLDDPTKAGVLYGIVVTIDPVVARSDIPNDDATGILVQNGGTQKATDAFYVGRNPSVSGVDWNAIFSSDAWASVGISLNGYHESYGIDMGTGTFVFAAMRLPNNVYISARNAANTDDVAVIKLASDDTVQLGASSSSGSSAKLVNTAGGYLKFEISNNATSQPRIAFSNTLQIDGPYRQTPILIANLPLASIAGVGARSFVSDSSVTTFASIVASGGSSPVPVYSDGTNWRVG